MISDQRLGVGVFVLDEGFASVFTCQLVFMLDGDLYLGVEMLEFIYVLTVSASIS